MKINSLVTNWKAIGLPGLLLVGLAVIVLTTAAAMPAAANGGSLVNIISVNGSGSVEAPPDVANVQLGIDIANADVAAAMTQANDLMTKVQEAVTGQGIEAADMQTVNFNVYTQDVYDPQTNLPTGERLYHVQNFLNVKVRDISKIGAVIDAGLAAGANNVSGLYFSVEDTKALEDEARTKAIEDARARAQALADGFGVKLGNPIIISEGVTSGGLPPYIPFAQDGRGAASVPISPGTTSVTVVISVTFQFTK